MLDTRIVMVASAIALAFAGAACLFAPVEVLTGLGLTGTNAVAGQMLGALYLAFAAANWTARGSMIGGIYARPLSVANFVHFMVGATILAKGLATSTLNATYIAVALAYLAFAILFLSIPFGRALRTGATKANR